MEERIAGGLLLSWQPLEAEVGGGGDGDDQGTTFFAIATAATVDAAVESVSGEVPFECAGGWVAKRQFTAAEFALNFSGNIENKVDDVQATSGKTYGVSWCEG